MNEERWAASCLSPWLKASLLLNDQIKSTSSEWLFGGKSGSGPMPRGFPRWPIKHGQLATASQKRQEWPAWKQAPWTSPRGGACAPRSPEPDGHMPGCLCHLPSTAHTCSADEDASPEGGTGHDPREASVDRAVLPLAPFLGFRVKKVPPTKKGWNSTSFLKTEGPSQASGGFSNCYFFNVLCLCGEASEGPWSP